MSGSDLKMGWKVKILRFQAVIFDMDGTLIDSLEDMLDSVNAVFAREGYPLRNLEQIRQAVGNGAALLISRNLPPQTSEEEEERILQLYKQEYSRRLTVKTRVYDGILPMLQTLKNSGVSLGVLSNKPHDAAVTICQELFPNLFDLVWGDRDGIPKKPDPTALLDAIRQLGASPASTAYVGDSQTDIQTAQNAGVYGVGVSWGFRPRQVLEAQGADVICDDAQQLAMALSR